jgi:hypothetical protein
MITPKTSHLAQLRKLNNCGQKEINLKSDEFSFVFLRRLRFSRASLDCFFNPVDLVEPDASQKDPHFGRSAPRIPNSEADQQDGAVAQAAQTVVQRRDPPRRAASCSSRNIASTCAVPQRRRFWMR